MIMLNKKFSLSLSLSLRDVYTVGAVTNVTTSKM